MTTPDRESTSPKPLRPSSTSLTIESSRRSRTSAVTTPAGAPPGPLKGTAKVTIEASPPPSSRYGSVQRGPPAASGSSNQARSQ